MTQEIIKIEAEELKLIEQTKATAIIKTFAPMVDMFKTFEKDYSDIITASNNGVTKELAGKAKRLRINIGHIRIETGKIKDREKEEYKKVANAIQGVHNLIILEVAERENKLKDIENYFEIQEKKRLDELQEKRVAEITAYVENAAEIRLCDMSDDVWQAYFFAKKTAYEDRIAAEKKAEEERIKKEQEEAAERERLKQENERLKREAAEKEKADKIAEIERKRAEEERNRQAKEKADIERAANEEKLRKEREAREKIEAELKAKKDAEEAQKKKEEEEKQMELAKGDKQKMRDLVIDLGIISTKYKFQSQDYVTMYIKINKAIKEIVDNIINY